MKALLKFFSPPVFPDDEEKTRSAYYLNAIVLSFAAIVTLFLIYAYLTAYLGGNQIFAVKAYSIIEGIIGIWIVVFFLEKNGRVETASYLYIFTIWAASTLLAINGNGVKDVMASGGYIMVVALSSLILGYRIGLWLTGFSALSVFALAYGSSAGLIVEKNDAPLVVAIQITMLLIFSALFIYLSLSDTKKFIKQIQKKSQDLEESNEALGELRETLENKAQERALALQKTDVENKRRAAQSKAVTQMITQKIASERDLNTLLSVITEDIGAQFNYYHVAIYLNDKAQEYTILSAANSKDGKRMMERGYKLALGQTSLVGYVAKAGNSQTGAETEFNNVEFPETRSEFALPLKVGAQIIGVLDLQSKDVDAFDQTDVEALTALANQITISIQNARMFNETQTALAESQLRYGTVIKQAWKSNLSAHPQIGYRYVGIEPIALSQEATSIEIHDAFENGDIAVTHPSRRKNENALAVPLKLRGLTIGVLNINFPLDTEIGEDEIDVARAATQRIAIALESASLLEESQRRAQREKTISEMSAKISGATEIETILKTVIRELSSQISGAQISAEIENQEKEEKA